MIACQSVKLPVTSCEVALNRIIEFTIWRESRPQDFPEHIRGKTSSDDKRKAFFHFPVSNVSTISFFPGNWLGGPSDPITTFAMPVPLPLPLPLPTSGGKRGGAGNRAEEETPAQLKSQPRKAQSTYLGRHRAMKNCLTTSYLQVHSAKYLRLIADHKRRGGGVPRLLRLGSTQSR